jgi:hypothetical protein
MPQALVAARSTDLGRRAHGPPDAVPDEALSLGERVPAGARRMYPKAKQ